jgi:hypothetical protein
MSLIGIGPPRWTKVREMSRTRGCSRAARRAACRSRELRPFNSSAVMIMRFAKIGLLPSPEMRVKSLVTPDSRVI